jgi:hypothetical protein
MQIIPTRPPNYDDILKVFPLASGQHVIFAYAPDIYSPSGPDLPRSLITHESVHIARQEAMGVKEWWNQYLTDPAFRYEEELLAHRAEYQSLARYGTRAERRQALKLVAKKLAAPLYGRVVTLERAMKDLRDDKQ